MSAHDLIADLSSGGRVESEGEFTLDRDKAREKLRKFQLADPLRYVLELVQAAHLQGAENIHFDIDANDMRMRFDGAPFSLQDFDQLYNALLSRGGTHSAARRQLALGVNAATALEPALIRVASGDGSQGVFLQLEAGKPDAFGALESDIPEGTVVQVRQRFSMGVAGRFFQNIAGRLPEEQLLKEHTVYARAKVQLEGKVLSRGIALDEHILGPVSLSAMPGHHQLGFDPRFPEAPARLHFVVHGVGLTTHRLDDSQLMHGLLGIIEHPKLQKDVSQADIVKDTIYHQILKAVEGHTLEVLAGMATSALQPELSELVARRLRARLTVGNSFRRLRMAVGGGSLRPLLDVTIYEDTAHAPLTLGELFALEKAHGHLPFSKTKGEVPEGYTRVVLLEYEQHRTRFQRLWGKRLRDLTSDVVTATQRKVNRAAWMRRKHPPRLNHQAHRYLARMPIAVPEHGIEGELGLRAEHVDGLRIFYVVEGALLCEHARELFSVPGLDLVLSGPFSPDDVFRDIVPRGDVFQAAIQAFYEALFELMATLPTLPLSPGLQTCALTFLEAHAFHDFVGTTLDILGYPRDLLKRSRTARRRGLAELLRPQEGPPHPLTDMPLFETLAPDTVLSLHDVSAHLEIEKVLLTSADRPGTLAFVESAPEAVWNEALERLSLASTPASRHILCLSDMGRMILAELHTGGLVEADRAVAFLRSAQSFFAKPQARASFNAELSVPIDHDGVTGELALRAPGSLRQNKRLSVTLLKYQRVLVQELFEFPGASELVAIVNDDTLPNDPSWEGLDPARADFGRIRVALAHTLPALISRLIEANAAEDVIGHPLHLDWAHAIFPTSRFLSVFERYTEAASDPHADYAELLKLAYRFSIAEVDNALTTRLRKRKSLLPEDIEDQLDDLSLEELVNDESTPPAEQTQLLAWMDVLFPKDALSFGARQQAPHPALLKASMACDIQGKAVTLGQLIDVHQREGLISYTTRRVPHPEVVGMDVVLFIDDEDFVDELNLIFGGGALRNHTQKIEGELRARAFELQPQLPSMAFDDDTVLVQVPVAEGRLEGFVGLAHPYEGKLSPSRVRLCKKHREITDPQGMNIEPQSWSARSQLEARFNDPDILFNTRHDDILFDKNRELRLRLADDARPELAKALAEHIGDTPPGPSAWNHVLDFLADPKFPNDALLDVAGFRTLSGDRCALRAVLEALENQANLYFAPPDQPAPGYTKTPPSERVCGLVQRYAQEREPWPWLVLAVAEREREVLQRQVESRRCAEHQAVHDYLEAAQQFYARPVQPLKLERLKDLQAPLEGSSLRGLLGWASGAIDARSGGVSFSLDGRPLCMWRMSFPVPNLELAVEAEGLLPDESWQDVTAPAPVIADLREALARALGPLLDKVVAEHNRDPERSHWSTVLLELSRALFPTRAFRDFYQRWRNASSVWQSRYKRLLELSSITSARRCSRLIHVENKKRGKRNKRVSPKSLAQHMVKEGLQPHDTGFIKSDVLHPFPSWAAIYDVLFPNTEAQWHERAHSPCEALRSALLFQTLDGSWISLGDVLAAFAAEGRVYHAAPFEHHHLVKERQVLRIRGDEGYLIEVLRCLLDEGGLENVDGWLEELEQAWRFEQRQTLAELKLSPTEALVALPVDNPNFTGEVGLPVKPHGSSRIRLCLQRREVGLDSWETAVELCGILNDDSLELSSDFTEIERDPRMGARRTVCVGMLDTLGEALAAAWPKLSEALQPNAWQHALDMLRARTRAAGLWELAGFTAIDGRRLSLNAIQSALKSQEAIYVIEEREATLLGARLETPSWWSNATEPIWAQAQSLVEGESRPLHECLVLRVGTHELEALERHLPLSRLGEVVAFLEQAEAFYARLPSMPQMPEFLASRTYRYGDIEVLIGFKRRVPKKLGDSAVSRCGVRLDKDKRRLARRSWPLPAGAGLEVQVEAPRLTPNLDWDDVVEDAALAEVRHAIARSLPSFASHLAQQAAGWWSENHIALLAGLTHAIFPTPRFRAYYQALSESSRETLYRQLLETASGLGFNAVDEALQSMEGKFSKRLMDIATQLHKRGRLPAWVDASTSRVQARPPEGTLAWIDTLYPARAQASFAERVLAFPTLLERTFMLPVLGGKQVSLGEAVSRFREQGQLDVVTEPRRLWAELSGPRLVLDLSAGTLLPGLLRSLLGSEALEDAQSWLEQREKRWNFDKRPTETLELSGVLAQIAVEGEVYGVLGLPARHPGTPEPSRVSLLYQQRTIGEDAWVAPVLLTGKINDDRIQPHEDYTRIARDPSRKERRALCEQHIGPLLADLSQRYESLAYQQKTAAWSYVLDAMSWRTQKGQGWEGLQGSPWSALLTVPGLSSTTSQYYSLEDARALVERQGHVYCLEESVVGEPLGVEVVFVLSTRERELFQSLFRKGTLEDYSETWKSERQYLSWKKKARPQPRCPKDALVSVTIEEEGLEGSLWLSASDERGAVALCTDERVVESIELEGELLRCSGVLSGSALNVHANRQGVTLTDDQQKRLGAHALRLRMALVDAYTVEKKLLRREAMRKHLETTLVALWMERKRPEYQHLRSFLERLRELPLLSLSNGRAVSLNVALEERPEALAHLELWESRAAKARPTRPGRSLRRRKRRKERQQEQERQPEDAPAEVPPETSMIEALTAELHLVRKRNKALLSDLELEQLSYAELPGVDAIVHCSEEGYVINGSHTVVQMALAHHDSDPVWISFLASALYTAVNVWLEPITNADEARFHLEHVKLVRTGR